VPATSVLLIEGGLKAHTFALMLDHSPVIGAVGGSFYQSPDMLREYLVGLLVRAHCQHSASIVQRIFSKDSVNI
jgi:hypothetical protein